MNVNKNSSQMNNIHVHGENRSRKSTRGRFQSKITANVSERTRIQRDDTLPKVLNNDFHFSALTESQ